MVPCLEVALITLNMNVLISPALYKRKKYLQRKKSGDISSFLIPNYEYSINGARCPNSSSDQREEHLNTNYL